MSCRLASIGCVALALACSPALPQPDLVFLIVVDTLRRDHVGAYGGSVETPAMDSLAARGQRFERASSSFHQTTMSMAALFTGQTPSLEAPTGDASLTWTGHSWCGMRRFRRAEDAADERCIPPSLPTLAEAMRDAGYETTALVSNEFIFRPGGYERGFDRWIEVDDAEKAKADIAAGTHPWVASARTRTGAHINAELRRVLPQERAGRHFIYLHYLDAHDALIHGSYADGVRVADRAIEELLAIVEAGPWAGRARYVLTSDHGEIVMPDGKHHHLGNPTREALLEVPLIVVPATQRSSQEWIRSEDLIDLLAEWVPFPPVARERTLARKRTLARDELLTSELYFQTLRRGRFKLVRARDDGTQRLVDLDADPSERGDVSAQHPEVFRELSERLEALRTALRPAEAAPRDDRALRDDEAERLRSLGYLDP